MGSLIHMQRNGSLYSKHHDEDPNDSNNHKGWELFIQIVLIILLYISIKNCS